MRKPIASGLFLVFLAAQFTSVQAIYTRIDQFQHWYPHYKDLFSGILHDNCSAQYDAYLERNISNPINQLPITYAWYPFAEPVVQCILNATPEFVKSDMAAAAVLLGLTPTILSLVAMGPEESSLMAIATTRPLLSFLVMAGSPALYIPRSFETDVPLNVLQQRAHHAKFPNFSSKTSAMLVLLQYVLSIGSIVNCITLSLQLGFQCIAVVEPDFPFFPLMWFWTAVLAHILGFLVFRLQMKVEYNGQRSKASRSLVARVKTWAKNEFRLSAQLETVDVYEAEKTIPVVAFRLLLCLYIICHLAFGTLTFSSLVFINTGDACGALIRYGCSVVVCKLVCMVEFAGLRHVKSQTKVAPPVEEMVSISRRMSETSTTQI